MSAPIVELAEAILADEAQAIGLGVDDAEWIPILPRPISFARRLWRWVSR